MNFQEWVDEYRPVMTERGEVFAYETYGSYAKFISEQDDRRVWTLLDYGDERIILSGWHWINRTNYFFTEKEWKKEWEFITLGDEDEINIFYSF